jgi:outer membrane immunogenic protein
MRRYFGWALASVISVGFGGLGGAMAADMAVKARPAPALAVWDWTGWYVGGNVGYGFGENTDPSLSFVNPGNAGNIGSFLTVGVPPGTSSGNLFPNLKPHGVFGGAQFGYDKQFGSWVLGAVADFQGADFKDSRTVTTPFATTGANVDERLSAKITWFGTVRGKAGYALGDWMVYGTGGLAYGNTESSIGFACTPGGLACTGVSFAGSASSVRAGWTAGAGVSHMIGSNWIVGLEYLHVDLGRTSVTAFTPINFTTTTITESQRFAEDLVRLTVDYKFGGPVVARY